MPKLMHRLLFAGAALSIFCATPLLAADKAEVGGNCCSDLEERIAELEATTAKKGNRKVSLNISGWVAEQVTYWDDGEDTGTYVGGLGKTLSSHLKLTGEARINPEWTAGYVMHIEVLSNDALARNQLTGDADSGVEVLQSYWFVKSKQLGKVSVGKQSTAADNAAMLVDGSGSMVPANWVLFDNASFFIRGNAGGTWGDLGTCSSSGANTAGDCAGVPLNAVRYDSPSFKGFSASASWAEDDYMDAALRYTGEVQGVKLAATVAHSLYSDDVAGVDDATYSQAGVYVEHVASGVFAYGAYGFDKSEVREDGKRYYVKAGVRERWVKMGHTVVYAEYGVAENMYNPDNLNFTVDGALFDRVNESELKHYGLGVVQEIDAAAMSLWLAWRHYEGEYSGTCTSGVNCTAADAYAADMKNFQVIKAGALINF
jgi:hypothetical protein